MLNVIWQFIKVLRYLLPFLKEVTSKPGEDECDENKRLILHRAVRKFIWSTVKFAVFLIVVFFVVIPLHTENQVLKGQVASLRHENAEIREVDRQLRESQMNTQNNFRDQGFRLTQQDDEIRQLNNRLTLCQTERSMFKPVEKSKPFSPEKNPAPSPQKSTLPPQAPGKRQSGQKNTLPYNPSHQELINKINGIQ